MKMSLTAYSEELAFLEKGRVFNEFETTAHWLKSDYNDLAWKIGSNTIYWNRILPDETRLDDVCNRNLLSKVKRIVFEIRNSPVSRNMNDLTHYNHSRCVLWLLDYVVMHKELYEPHKYYFSALDQQGMIEFISLIAADGPDGVTYIKHRLQKIFTKIVNEYKSGNICLNHIVPEYIHYNNSLNIVDKTFSNEDIKIIKNWMYINKYYEFNIPRSNEIKKGLINRKYISGLLGKKVYKFSDNVNIYLRQFEFVTDYNDLELNDRFSNCEYIPSNSLLVDESVDKPSSESIIDNLEGSMSTILRLNGFIDGLPSENNYESIKPYIATIRKDTKAINHYRTTPVPIALNVMNESIRFLMLYGEPLVDYCLQFIKKCRTAKNQQRIPQIRNNILAKIPMPVALKPLNINTTISYYDYREYKMESLGRYAAAKVRTAMSLEDAISLLISSVYILIVALSAQRKEAICDLRLDCLTGTEGCYELNLTLPKANFNDCKMEISRPIPDLVAKGIKLINKFTTEWASITGVNNQGYLFWIPMYLKKGSRLAYDYLDTLLDRFSDYIELPLDEKGRRWYIRSHESRRFFAIVFFWQFKFANISALQWMLGHVNPEHTYEYIKELIGGSELTIEEARLTCDAIKSGGSNKGLTELRHLVKRHFNTDEIQILDKDDIELYLIELLDKGVYKIVPHSLETSEGIKYEILFEVTAHSLINGENND